ncbi:MAG: anthranilate phosphoribosyltransferase [Candidatus Omnitrophota bacterium]|nr:anthranilate phosphoribosyltransferase [Candidatus Omnitrophota bacterium]MDZ4242947.1 anthranilate phosphoribosyltransferase [Candidatus Omnitrophota bacterium]
MKTRECIVKIRSGLDLSQAEIGAVMQEIMSGSAPAQEIKDFLLALNDKGPTVDEITGAAQILRQFSIRVPAQSPVVMDTCGTGGDRKDTFNISSLVALAVAGAGVTVAKHGNRSVSSRCGSADVLEGLGVKLDIPAERLSECLDKIGIAFLFAQRLHPAMKNVAAVRKELGVKTIFNILGPLINPAFATHQVIGIYSRDFVGPMAQVLKNLGIARALVVHGSDGLDEITTTGKTFASEFNGRDVVSYEIDPKQFGIAPVEESALKGGDLSANLQIARDVLGGVKGPQREIVVLNAAYALLIAGKAADVKQGMTLAAQSLDSGAARKKLEDMVRFTNAG